jgi:putative transcriptional regulator
VKLPKNRKPLFERLKTGLEEAILQAKGEIILKNTTLERPDRPPELKAEDVIRIRLDNQMSQAMFARLLNVSPKTVQSWEHGTRKPSQAALRLIQVFQQDPSGVLSVVGMSRTHEANSKKR